VPLIADAEVLLMTVKVVPLASTALPLSTKEKGKSGQLPKKY
jgi:hypothetical protein